MSVETASTTVKFSVYTQLLVEITDFCNYDCKMCSRNILRQPFSHSWNPSFMKIDLWKKLLLELPQLSPHTPTAIKLFWLGESLLHPQFEEFLFIAYDIFKNKEGRFYLDLHTNGYFLDSFWDVILKYGEIIPRITFSLDAYSSRTYRKVRRGGNLARVVRNVVDFFSKRENLALKKPRVILQFIVLEDNVEEIKFFIDFWAEILGKIIKYFDLEDKDVIWIKKAEGFLGEKDKYYQRLYEKVKLEIGNISFPHLDVIFDPSNYWKGEEESTHQRKLYCGAPFTSPVVDVKGNLYPCCFSDSPKMQLGNLYQDSFSSVWWKSEKIKVLRKKLLGGRIENLPSVCHDCPTYQNFLPEGFIKFIKDKEVF